MLARTWPGLLDIKYAVLVDEYPAMSSIKEMQTEAEPRQIRMMKGYTGQRPHSKYYRQFLIRGQAISLSFHTAVRNTIFRCECISIRCPVIHGVIQSSSSVIFCLISDGLIICSCDDHHRIPGFLLPRCEVLLHSPSLLLTN